MNILKSIDHDRAMLHGPVGRVSRMVLLAMGPGFCSEMILVRW